MTNENIWHSVPDPQALNLFHQDTAVAALGIQITEVGADYLAGTMPVDKRTMQPFGLLHGGAAVLLLESLASAAANQCVDTERVMCVGLEVNCNHVRALSEGTVFGRARSIHLGRRYMVWELTNHDDEDRLVTTGRLTVAVVER